MNDGNVRNLKLRLISYRTIDGRIYIQWYVLEVAILIVSDVDLGEENDIIMQTKGDKHKTIDEFRTSYLAYQYSLIFTYDKRWL